jgi:tRNA threonylcarbamoyladenosine biosynthesis protein TsaB
MDKISVLPGRFISFSLYIFHMLILSLDTATGIGSVAITDDTRLLAMRTWGRGQQSHSNNVLVEVDNALKESSLNISDIDLFAVAVGPGSFTGLRIGLATVKAFAATLNRKCIGVSTLEALAHAAGSSSHTVAMLPAGRGEVFAQSLSIDSNNHVKALNSPVHIPPSHLLQQIDANTNRLLFVGEGAELNLELIKDRAKELGIEFNADPTASISSNGWTIASPKHTLASSIAAIAWTNFKDANGPEELHAIYVRPSDAELKR